ncbi:hypothetical protein OAG51_03415 [Pirellulaceae bacterium]|jgi:hypothetical protein|nr:hypothetical protein [Pirellulaceae bacterium]
MSTKSLWYSEVHWVELPWAPDLRGLADYLTAYSVENSQRWLKSNHILRVGGVMPETAQQTCYRLSRRFAPGINVVGGRFPENDSVF